MTEYEWESGRVPRGTRAGIVGGTALRPNAVSEYVALEIPREHVGWLLSPEGAEVGRAAAARRRKDESGAIQSP